MNAARSMRRVPAAEAVPALVEAVRTHRDEFVRYRALVLLTSFNDREDRRPDARAAARSQRSPARGRVPVARAASGARDVVGAAGGAADRAGGVRPAALVRALAALGNDPQVQRALVAELAAGSTSSAAPSSKRSASDRAAYAVDAIAAVAKLDGPLQDDAVLALGRIGGARATEPLAGYRRSPAPTMTGIAAGGAVPAGRRLSRRISRRLVDACRGIRRASSRGARGRYGAGRDCRATAPSRRHRPRS